MGRRDAQNAKCGAPTCRAFAGNGVPDIFRRHSAELYRLVWLGWVILRVAIIGHIARREGVSIMSHTTIKDIYAGMPDAKDEISTNQIGAFLGSFVVPPELPIDSLLKGRKFLISGYKGVGKTSVLYYLQNEVQNRDASACTSFIYFKSDFEEVRKSNLDAVAKKLTALIDVSGEIQTNKIEFLHIWRWVFFKKIVDDSIEKNHGLFKQDDDWNKFEKAVNQISFSSREKHVISLSSLSVSVQASPSAGVSAGVKASFNKEIAKSNEAFRNLVDIVDKCEELFQKLTPSETPYYIFVDEMEAYYGDVELLKRDLTLIRDMLFTIHRINNYRKVHIIAAIRNEITFAMDRFIQTNELNKITDGFSVPIRWTYSNTNSYNHPIIQILMKRIAIASNDPSPRFHQWFPKKVNNKDTANYILDNGWNKPRDIVRLLIAAQNDSLHCNDTAFTQAAFDSLRKEYSKNSLTEIRQELQSLYSSEEIEMVVRLVRGGQQFTTAEEIRKRAPKGSRARAFWDERQDDILEDFYRVGFWGNVNRRSEQFSWRWNHKGDTGVLYENGWELAIHPALCSELSIR